MIEKLACPVCHNKYDLISNKVFHCKQCNNDYEIDNNIFNFFPILGNHRTKELDGNISSNGLSLSKKDINELLTSARLCDLRRADKVIQSIICPLEKLNDNELKEIIPKMIELYEYFYQQNSKYLSEDANSCLLTIGTLLRYELECMAKSYSNSFVLPDYVIDILPFGDYLEVAIGPGNNIRKILDSGKADTVTGCDISKRMIGAIA